MKTVSCDTWGRSETWNVVHRAREPSRLRETLRDRECSRSASLRGETDADVHAEHHLYPGRPDHAVHDRHQRRGRQAGLRRQLAQRGLDRLPPVDGEWDDLAGAVRDLLFHLEHPELS